MNAAEDSILAGLSVHTVAEIADGAWTLKREARIRTSGKVAGVLIECYGRIIHTTPAVFLTEAQALEYLDELVSACSIWHLAHEPVCVADSCFSC